MTIVHSRDHILNAYDDRISKYAEAKFSRDDIRILKGRYVKEVRATEVETTSYTSRLTGESELVPCGMCVWYGPAQLAQKSFNFY